MFSMLKPTSNSSTSDHLTIYKPDSQHFLNPRKAPEPDFSRFANPLAPFVFRGPHMALRRVVDKKTIKLVRNSAAY